MMTVLGDILQRRNISVSSFSEQSGIPRRMLLRYISGEMKPSWENALKIYYALNLVEYQFVHMMDPVDCDFAIGDIVDRYENWC